MAKSKPIKTNDSGSKNNERQKADPSTEKEQKDNSKKDKNVAGNKDNQPEEQVTDKASKFILPVGTIIGTNIQSADTEKD